MLTGVLLALAAAACFECSYVLQALEVRAVPAMQRPGLGALRALVARPVWVASIALGLAGFALQVLALREAPLTLVQPLLATGLLGLLAFSAFVLHEKVGRREIGAVVAIVAGVSAIALSEPERSDTAPGLAFVLVAAALALLTACAFVRRRPGSGLLLAATIAADTLAALAAAQAARTLPAIVPTAGWGALAAAGGIAAIAAESAVLQRRGAARVAPIVLAGQVAVPVMLAPLVIGERWNAAGLIVAGLALVVIGSALLASSAGVSRLAVGAGEPEDEVGSGR